MADWYHDLRRAFAWALPDDLAEGNSLPEPFYHGLVDVFGGERRDVDFVHPVSQEGSTGFLIVRGERVWLVRFEAPATTEVSFLGDLQGGRYTERLVLDEKGDLEIDGIFRHRRLGRNGDLHARIIKPSRQPDAWTSDDTDRAIERGRLLREAFQRWSASEPFQPDPEGS